jgi:exosortase/archaeosortase family protein
LNVPVTTQGTGIFHAAFAVDIRRGCDGVEATILLVSACLAYPLSWRNRALGTVWGYLLIFVANLIRVVGLFLIGAKASLATFNLFHVYVSQFAVIALTMVFWIYWIGRARTHNA